MKYKERMAGVKVSRLQSMDFSIVAAMLALIIMAWAVVKLEDSFIKQRASFRSSR